MTASWRCWVAWIERHRVAVVVVSVALCLLSAASLTRLRLDLDVLGMLPQGAPEFDSFKAFVADFGELDELVVLLRGASLPEMESFADQLATRLERLDSIDSVHERVDVEALLDGILGRYLFNYLPEQGYRELADRLTPAGIEAQVEADRAVLAAPLDLSAAGAIVEDPLGVRRMVAARLAQAEGKLAPAESSGYFVAPGGSALLVLVRPRQSAFDVSFSERLMRQVREAEADVRRGGAWGNLQVDYTGSYVYALEDAATIRGDVTRYSVLALLGVLGVFYIGYRGLRILPFVTYPLIVTTLLTFAFSVVLFEQLNAVSISFAAILYGLSIDSGIHFYTRLQQERGRGDLRRAVEQTLAHLGRANVAASATTAAVFAIIAFSVLGAVRQLGILTAIGMVLNSLEFFTLYPALAFLLLRGDGGAAPALDTPGIARIATGAARHARVAAAVVAVAAVVLLALSVDVGFDVHLDHLRPRGSAAARVQAAIAELFAGEEMSGAILVRRPGLQPALEDSEVLAGALEHYRRDGRLQAMQSLESVLPSERVQRARLAAYARLPRAAAVGWLRQSLQRNGFAVAPFEPFLASFRGDRTALVHLGDAVLAPVAEVIDRHLRMRRGEAIVATYVQPAAQTDLAEIGARLRQDAPAVPFDVAGRPLLEQRLGKELKREAKWFLVLALLGNLGLLLLGLGSAATALAVLAPVAVALLAVFACMSLLGITLDPVNLTVVPLILGLGVDDGVYILAVTEETGDLTTAFRRGGRALIITSLTTVAGFGFLGFSRYPALATMGRLAALGLFLCMVLTITVLPALLVLVSRGPLTGQSAMRGR